jgi:hypothetical protein
MNLNQKACMSGPVLWEGDPVLLCTNIAYIDFEFDSIGWPCAFKADPVLLSANITYIEFFEFDPVASQQAPPPSQQVCRSRNQNPSSFCETSFFTNTTKTHVALTMRQTTINLSGSRQHCTCAEEFNFWTQNFYLKVSCGGVYLNPPMEYNATQWYYCNDKRAALSVTYQNQCVF